MSDKVEAMTTEQSIPMHYHFNMLNDVVHLQAFKEAIQHVVKPGDRVVDLGGGTGVLSFFAAQQAEQVIYVEKDAELVASARELAKKNTHADRIEFVHADVEQFLPNEPVDVVICDMLHVGMLREQQMAVIESFKQRYQIKFPGQLPNFLPEACIQAVQPIEQDFNFEGFNAPTPVFQVPTVEQSKTKQLAPPEIFQLFTYDEVMPKRCECEQRLVIATDGKLNAVRMITKNILAILIEQKRNLEWFNQYLVVPLEEPLQVKAGDEIVLRFSYLPGAQIDALASSLQVSVVSTEKTSKDTSQCTEFVG